MPTRKRTPKIQQEPQLTEEQIHYLKTGEILPGDDFSAFLVCPGHNAEADRKEFEAIRRSYPPGTFPWAESKFGREA